MTHRIARLCGLAAAAGILTIAAGCLDRTEDIVVDENGNATISVEMKGDAKDFAPPMALPTAPDWEVTDHSVDTSSDGKINVTLKAEKSVEYGQKFPTSFVVGKPEVEGLDLEFQTNVRVWRDRGRTFYEFKRSYAPRQHRAFDLSESAYWDKDLEKRVIDSGIFKVSEQDRNDYLDQYAAGFSYYNYRTLWAVLGRMVHNQTIPVSEMEAIEQQAVAYLEARITRALILGLLDKPDDSVAAALNQLEIEIKAQFDQLVSKSVDNNSGAIEMYTKLYNDEKAVHDMTERFDGQSFSLTLDLPGVIIEANGYIQEDKNNEVEWEFKGDDLHDAELTMYALSVLDSNPR